MKRKLKERLALLEEAKGKVRQMQAGSAFVTDFGACSLLERLAEAYQEMLLENLELKKERRMQKINSLMQRIDKKNKE